MKKYKVIGIFLMFLAFLVLLLAVINATYNPDIALILYVAGAIIGMVGGVLWMLGALSNENNNNAEM